MESPRTLNVPNGLTDAQVECSVELGAVRGHTHGPLDSVEVITEGAIEAQFELIALSQGIDDQLVAPSFDRIGLRLGTFIEEYLKR